MELKRKRRFQSAAVMLKVAAARILTAFSPKLKSRPVVLVGGNLGEKYEDNAAVFHQYLMENWQEHYDIRWMYDPDTSYVRQQGIEKAVPLGSFRNYVLFFRAAYTVHGHSLMYDIAPHISKYIFLNRKTKMVHISHGIECFKKILIQPEDVPLLERCDLFNCASVYERRIKRDEWGMPEEKLPITGMARFDRLPYNQSAAEVKSILMMMTWRETLMDLSEDEFLASDYFQATAKLLNDRHFNEMLAAAGAELKVVLHPFMKQFEHHFVQLEKKEVQTTFYTFDELSIQREISRSDMLITDYSSIFWDFVYMNRPVIFYTFDQEDFLKMRGSYLDLDNDLLGWKARSKDEVVASLSRILEEGMTENPRFSELPRYVDYTDGKNCERLARTMFHND